MFTWKFAENLISFKEIRLYSERINLAASFFNKDSLLMFFPK